MKIVAIVIIAMLLVSFINVIPINVRAEINDYQFIFKTPDEPTLTDVSDVAVDNEGNIYAVTVDGVVKLDSNGKFLFKFGSEGSNDGEFIHPERVAYDPNNNRIIVADRENDRIQVFEKRPQLPTIGANVMQGMNIDLETNLALPFDREANDSITLRFIPKADDIVGHHLDYHVEITRDGEQVWDQVLHDHDGVLELIITPSEGVPEVSGGEAGEGNVSTAPYTISGAIFNENGQYTIRVEVVGIDHNPLEEPTAEDQFGISVVPEFPLAAIIPLVVGFTVIAAMRVRKITF